MGLNSGGYESVGHSNGPSSGFATRNDFTPEIGHNMVDGYDSPFEAQWKLVGQPLLQPLLPGTADRHFFDSVTEFCERNHAEEYAIFVRMS